MATAEAQAWVAPARKGIAVVVVANVVVVVEGVAAGAVVMGRVGSAEHAAKRMNVMESRRMGPGHPKPNLFGDLAQSPDELAYWL